jgi:hypothetical protein
LATAHSRHVRIKKNAIPLIGFDVMLTPIEITMIMTIAMAIVAFTLCICPHRLNISIVLTLDRPP